jgi:membrane fusion protein (multidrug efflux system)
MRNALYPLILLNLCLLLLAAGCGSDGSSVATAASQPAVVAKPASVTVQIVTAQDLEEHLTLPGTLHAWEDLTLAAEIAGVVDWVGPHEGETLTAGQRILTIDSLSQKGNLERDRVDAKIKQQAMQRLEKLVAENLVSRQEYENSVSAHEESRQQLELSRIALQKSIVTAPVDGVLDARLVERGEYLKVGDPVAVLLQIDRLKALIDIPEKDVRYLHSGEEVRVIQAQIDTGEEISRSGTLIHLAYKADPLTRTYLGKIEIDNRDRQLRPGMIVRIEALRRQLKDAIAVPLYAVVELDGRKVVFIEDQGKAHLRPVRIDRIIGDRAVILAGLDLNERLIVKGQQLLSDGAAVKVEAD